MNILLTTHMMASLFNTRSIRSVVLILVAIITFATCAYQPASAISHVMPDPAEYGSAGSGGDIRLALSYTPSTKNINQLKMGIYVRAPENATPSSVRARVDVYSFYYTYGESDFKRLFRVYAQLLGNHCISDTLSDVDVGNFTWSSDYNVWYAPVTFTLVNRDTSGNACTTGGNPNIVSRAHAEAMVEFKLRIDQVRYRLAGDTSDRTMSVSNNAWVGYTVPDDNGYFGTDARSRGGGFANYSLQLATPCYITERTPGRIELYDLDSGHSDNNGGSVNVEVIDLRTNKKANYTTSGSKGNGKSFYINLKFDPGRKYRLKIEHIYYWNVLQYKLPFDNIAYAVGCPPAATGQVAPGLQVDPDDAVVFDGQELTGHFSIDSSSTAPSQVRGEHCVWYDNDEDYGNGGRVVAGACQTGDYSVGADGVTEVATRPHTAQSSGGREFICFSWRLISSPTPGISVDTDVQYECRRIGRTPTVQILGNDLRVGSGFLFSPNQPSEAYGTVSQSSASWVEYAITAPSNVSSLASQSGAKGGGSDEQSAWSKLTFANNDPVPAGCLTGLGCFAGQNSLGKIPNIGAVLATAQMNGAPITYNAGAGATISSLAGVTGDIANFNRSLVIMSTGTITIDRDISYRSGSFTAARDIPQLVIIARNIDIAPNVGRVDAWLVANDTVNTCSGVAQPTLSNCDVPLRINGPVMASQLRLNRTYQNASDLGRAAEEIDLRGDAYIWANAVSRQNGHIQTTYITELPPRY